MNIIKNLKEKNNIQSEKNRRNHTRLNGIVRADFNGV